MKGVSALRLLASGAAAEQDDGTDEAGRGNEALVFHGGQANAPSKRPPTEGASRC